MSGVNPLNLRVRAFLATGCTLRNSIKLSTQKISIPNFQFKDSMATHPWWMGFLPGQTITSNNYILWHVNLRDSTQIQPL